MSLAVLSLLLACVLLSPFLSFISERFVMLLISLVQFHHGFSFIHLFFLSQRTSQKTGQKWCATHAEINNNNNKKFVPLKMAVLEPSRSYLH